MPSAQPSRPTEAPERPAPTSGGHLPPRRAAPLEISSGFYDALRRVGHDRVPTDPGLRSDLLAAVRAAGRPTGAALGTDRSLSGRTVAIRALVLGTVTSGAAGVEPARFTVGNGVAALVRAAWSARLAGSSSVRVGVADGVADGVPWSTREAVEALSLDPWQAPLATWLRELPLATRREIDVEFQRQVRLAGRRWPAPSPAWWPRVREPIASPVETPAGPAVLTARLPLVLGVPGGRVPSLAVVDCVPGPADADAAAVREALALAVTLRDGVAPITVASYSCSAGTLTVDPVDAVLLHRAAHRVGAALEQALVERRAASAARAVGAHDGEGAAAPAGGSVPGSGGPIAGRESRRAHAVTAPRRRGGASLERAA